MTCPRCQYENPPGSNFCLGCGTRLGATCGACGHDLPAGSRFCNKCGTPVRGGESAGQARFASLESYTPPHLAEKILTSKSALEGERKQVSVLFADLKGSMELLADRDPEEARRLPGLDAGAVGGSASLPFELLWAFAPPSRRRLTSAAGGAIVAPGRGAGGMGWRPRNGLPSNGLSYPVGEAILKQNGSVITVGLTGVTGGATATAETVVVNGNWTVLPVTGPDSGLQGQGQFSAVENFQTGETEGTFSGLVH